MNTLVTTVSVPGMQYANFIVRVGRERDSAYEVHVDSPAGEGETWLLRSAVEALPDTTPREVGAALFEALFRDRVPMLYAKSRGMVAERGEGLRIVLKFDPRIPEVLRFQSLPWELLYEPATEEFLSLGRVGPVVRYLEAEQPPRPLTLPPTWRVLVLKSNPRGTVPLDLEREVDHLREALDSRAELVVVDNACFTKAAERLRETFHVVHFLGHGEFDDERGAGQLVFTAADGGPDRVDGRRFAAQLRGRSVAPLVVLNACGTARMSAAASGDLRPFAGVASALVLAGMPAVLAMRSAISDDAAIAFSGSFYRSLAEGDPVETAVTNGRLAVDARDRDGAEWAKPVLFLRDRTSGGTDQDNVEPPSPPPPVPAGRLRRFLAERKKILAMAAGAVAAIPALFYGLGLLALRSRESLLGLTEPLTYSTHDAVLTSLQALGTLPRGALLALFSGDPWLLAGSWGALGVVAAVMASSRWRSAARAVSVLLVLVWVLLLFATRFYQAALFPPHADAPGPVFDIPLDGNPVASTRFEVVSWLQNDDERNEIRRQALAGLVVWLLAAAGASAYHAWRRTDLSRRWRRTLGLGFVVLAVLVAGLVPRAYVVMEWGLRYPQKQVDATCDAELAETVAGCCIFDVSAGGSPRTLLLWGDGCPESEFRTWSETQEKCLVQQVERMISDDC